MINWELQIPLGPHDGMVVAADLAYVLQRAVLSLHLIIDWFCSLLFSAVLLLF